jgi:hypothetical protein
MSTAPSARAVGHSTRVADIIMLTVVVAVLFAIAVRGSSSATPEQRESQWLVFAGMVAGSAIAALVTAFVQRSILASLYGASVGAGVAAALPAMLWGADVTPAVFIGGGVMLAVGTVLGTLRRRGESAANDGQAGQP